MDDDKTKSPAIILPGLPANSFCGIDLLSFTTSPKFWGLKHLPPGWHFVFCSPTNSFSLRQGAWFEVSDPFKDGLVEAAVESAAPGDAGWRPDVFVLKWESAKEELVPEQSEAALLRWRANLGNLWREGLAPYRQSAGKKQADGGEDSNPTEVDAANEEGEEEHNYWHDLTNCIHANLLRRITEPEPANGAYEPARPPSQRLDTDYFLLNSASSSKQDMDTIPGLWMGYGSSTNSNESGDQQPLHDHILKLSPIDLKQTWRPGAIGRERTDAAQDRSWALNNLIDYHCFKNELDVVGEMQFAFLMTLTLNNYSCFEQWKRLLSLCLTCKDAVAQRPNLFVKLLSTLRVQLERCGDAEGALFDLTDEAGNLLKSLLVRFRRNVENIEGSMSKQEVLDEAGEVEEFLSSEHGWTFGGGVVRKGLLDLEDGDRVEMEMDATAEEDDEEGEYAPQFIDLTDEQFSKLGGEGVALTGDELADVLRKSRLKGSKSKEVEQSDSDDSSIRIGDDEELAEEIEEDQDLEDMDTRF